MPYKDPEVAKAYFAARRAERRAEAKANTAKWGNYILDVLLTKWDTK